MKGNRIKTPLLLLLLFSCPQLRTQSQPKEATTLSLFHNSIYGGVPYGISTFSFLGKGMTRAEVNFETLRGYRINHIFSVEFSAMLGQMGFGSSKHIASRHSNAIPKI